MREALAALALAGALALLLGAALVDPLAPLALVALVAAPPKGGAR